MKYLTIASLLILSLSLQVAGYEPPTRSKLSGHLIIAGESFMDPGPDYKKDSHMLITITGESAQVLYDSLKVPEKKFTNCPWQPDGDCFDKIEKVSNGIFCRLSLNKKAICDITYDLENQKFMAPKEFNAGGDI